MKKYWAYTRMNMLNAFAFRGSMFVWLVGNIIFTLINIAVWQSSSAGVLIGGYTKSELTSYYIVSLFLQWLIFWYPFDYVFHEIKDGHIILTTLTKPVSFFVSIFFTEIGWHLVSTIVGLLTSVFIAVIFQQNFAFYLNQVNLFFFLLSLFLGALITFSLSINMGLLAFWFTEVGAIESIFWIGRSLLGGAAIPISFIPPAFKRLAIFLPFRYSFSFPLEILFAKVSASEAILGLLLGFAWSILLFFLYRLFWKKGRKVYSAFGQ